MPDAGIAILDSARHTVNDAGVARCQALIESRQYVLDSDWGAVQPGLDAVSA